MEWARIFECVAAVLGGFFPAYLMALVGNAIVQFRSSKNDRAVVGRDALREPLKSPASLLALGALWAFWAAWIVSEI